MLNISPLHIPVPNTNLPTTPTSNFVHSDISESNETVPSLVNEVLHQVDTLKTEPSSNKMLPDLPNLTAIKTNDTITHSFDRLTEKNLLLNNNFNDYFSLKTHQQSKQSIESPASTEILSARDKTPQQFHQSEFQDSPDTPDLQLETSHPHFAKIPPHQTHSTGHQNQAHTNHSHNHHFSHHAETISEFPQTLRRHTSPHAIYQHKHGILSNIRNSLDGPSLTTLMSKVNRTLVPRSTFPSHFKSEFTRDHARNSIGSKRRKKRWLDDDNVIMGNKISEGHENFVMAYNMLTGIRVAVSRCSGVMNKITDEDFKTTKKLLFNMDGSELTPSSKYDFKFKDYCPEVFRDLRTLFGLDPADYLVSITGKYILSELGSPGKSGSFFYYSRDYRFIIKTIHHSEHKQLRRILKDYYGHVKENPNTLISQFYGLHRLKMPFKNGSKKVHFVVMNNLFPPHRDIHLKYDLKGSTWGRITRIDKDTDLSQVTLKDINWLERQDKINLGPSKRKLFFQQLDADVKLLKKINVMDYSLLLGVHDVKRGNTDELKLSVFDPKSSNKSELIKTNPRDIDREIDLPNQVFPGRTRFIFYGHDGGIRATNGNNEPLYQIYYLGIIDCLTNYGCKKRLETAWRSFSHPRETISAVPANEYGDRFLKFIKDGTTKFKEKRQ